MTGHIHTLPARFAGTPKPGRAELRFAASPATVGLAAKKAVSEVIPHIDFAERLERMLRGEFFNYDIRFGGLAVEDIVATVFNVFAISIPQAIEAHRRKVREWERNSQNLIGTPLGFFLSMVFKNQVFGPNKLLDSLMKPQGPPPERTTWLGRKLQFFLDPLHNLLNPLRLKVDYFDILKEAELPFEGKDRTKAFWSTLDANSRTLINGYYNKLKCKAAKGSLTEAEKVLHQEVPRFIRRLSILPIIIMSFITLTTIYITGHLLTHFILKVFSPIDKKLERERLAKAATSPNSPRTAASRQYGLASQERLKRSAVYAHLFGGVRTDSAFLQGGQPHAGR